MRVSGCGRGCSSGDTSVRHQPQPPSWLASAVVVIVFKR